MHSGNKNPEYEYNTNSDDRPSHTWVNRMWERVGVHVDYELNFRPYINKVSKKANCI